MIDRDIEEPELIDNIYVVYHSVRRTLDRIVYIWGESYDLDLDGFSTPVVNRESRVLDIDIIDSDDNADNAYVSDRMVEVKVYVLTYDQSVSTDKSGILEDQL